MLRKGSQWMPFRENSTKVMADFRVSGAAIRDIEEIGRYTQERWGVAQRRTYLAGLEERLHEIVATPMISPERTEFSPPVRFRPYGEHQIIYIIDAHGVLIVCVLHRHMDFFSHLE